jgi:tRNA(Ile)-lysidine synthase
MIGKGWWNPAAIREVLSLFQLSSVSPCSQVGFETFSYLNVKRCFIFNKMCLLNDIRGLTGLYRPLTIRRMRTIMRRAPSNQAKISRFSKQLLAEWRKLRLPIDEPLVVAVSGGADSTALFLALDELKRSNKISAMLFAAHLDHGLRPTSKKEAAWVTQLAKRLGHSAVVSHTKVREIADAKKDNLEQVARKLRYDFLERTAKRKKAQFVLTGHTMDDQAETVLLRLMRGSAAPGLGGIDGIRPLSGDIRLVRPLLWARRADTEDYCREQRQEFLLDEMNSDETYARVKVRKQLLPLMESFNARVVEAISRSATLLREDSSELHENAAALLKKAVNQNNVGASKTKLPTLDVQVLSAAPSGLRRRALREWIRDARGDARRLEMVHLVAVERLLEGTAGGRVVELPGGARVRRLRGKLELEPGQVEQKFSKGARRGKTN